VYSYLHAPEKAWEAHFRFARAASAHSVRYLGIEHSLPTRADVLAAEKAFREAA
jgi:sulfofructose kinase